MGELVRFSPLPTVKELLRLYRLKALKKLSQNFLLEKRLTDKIVNVLGDVEESEICEIGPGPGSITRSLLARQPRRVFAVEKDTRFRPMLEALENTAQGKLEVIYADILEFNMSKIFDESLAKNWEDEPPKIHIIGNLPFAVSNVLLFQFLHDMSLRRNAWRYGRVCLTLTFQEEVARRMTSDILLKGRSRISVMCQNWCQVQYKFQIPGKAFLPKPEVDVAVVHLEPLVTPVIDLDFCLIEKVLRTAFNARQKLIIHNLRNLFPKKLRTSLTEELFERANLDSRLRPYQISNEEWKRICSAYKELCDENPIIASYDYRGPIKDRERLSEDTNREQISCQ